MIKFAQLPRLPAPYFQILVALAAQLVVLEIEPGPWIQQGGNLLFTFWMALGAVTITGRRTEFWILLVLGSIPALLELAVSASSSPLALSLFKEGLWAAFPLYLAFLLVRKLFFSREISHHEVVGSVTAYLLVGLSFSDIYEVILALDSQAMVFPYLPEGVLPQFSDLLYFSFVTLATLGYGDVVPLHPLARLAAVAEAVMGLMLLAILVARLVSMHSMGGFASKSGSSDPQ